MSPAPILLALETSTAWCSAALLVDEVIHEQTVHAPRAHNEHLLGQVQQLLDDADQTLGAVDAIAFGCGPGSFTGVRLATAVAQGLAVGADLPLIPISSLAALAARAWLRQPVSPVAAALDARLGEVYYAVFDVTEHQVIARDPEQAADPKQLCEEIEAWSGPWQGVGTGFALPALQSLPGQSVDLTLYPDARTVVQQALRAWQRGEICDVEQAQPTYLRHPVRS